MELEITRNFARKYKKKSPEKQEKVEKTLRLLETDPHYPGLHTHKVQGTYGIFECYVDDTLRVTFQYGDNCILLRNSCEHDAVLRGLP